MPVEYDIIRKALTPLDTAPHLPQDKVARLTHLITRLPEQDQIVLALLYSEGLDVTEAAVVLQMPESQVSQLREGAEAHFRNALTVSSRTHSLETL